MEWTSDVYRSFENDGFITAALSISAAYSFPYNITIVPYQLSSDSVSQLYLSTVALGWYITEFSINKPIKCFFIIILGNDIDFHSEPFNVTVLKYRTNVTVNVSIYPDGDLSLRKVFGLRFNVPNNVGIKSGSLNESRAEIINTDSKLISSSFCVLMTI